MPVLDEAMTDYINARFAVVNSTFLKFIFQINRDFSEIYTIAYTMKIQLTSYLVTKTVSQFFQHTL